MCGRKPIGRLLIESRQNVVQPCVHADHHSSNDVSCLHRFGVHRCRSACTTADDRLIQFVAVDRKHHTIGFRVCWKRCRSRSIGRKVAIVPRMTCRQFRSTVASNTSPGRSLNVTSATLSRFDVANRKLLRQHHDLGSLFVHETPSTIAPENWQRADPGEVSGKRHVLSTGQ